MLDGSRHDDAATATQVFRPGDYPPWDPASSIVAFERRELFDEMVWHEHGHLEIALVLEGGGVRGLGDVVEPCEDGDLCLSAEQTPHGCNARRRGGRVRALVVHFSRAPLATAFSAPELGAVRALLDRARDGVVVGGRTRDMVADELLKLFAEPPGSWKRPLRLLDVLGMIATSDDVRSVTRGRACTPRRQRDARLRELARHIEQCGLHDGTAGISHAEAASRLGMSAASFSRFFKRAVGRTFEDYLNDVRVAQACRMLIDSDRSVLDIAFDVGFNSAAHFNRRFRRDRGMTPTEYRRRAVVGRAQ